MPVAEESAAVAAAAAGLRWIITFAVAWVVLYLSPSSCARYMETHAYTTQSSRNLQAQQHHCTQKQPGTICHHFQPEKPLTVSRCGFDMVDGWRWPQYAKDQYRSKS